jgi:hypothetical protein
MWLPNDDLLCDTCENCVYNQGARGSTLMRARARGWHVYDGPSADGSQTISSHLCPECVGSPRKGPQKREPMKDDIFLPLFSEAA